MAAPDVTQAETLGRLYGDMAAGHLTPLWTLEKDILNNYLDASFFEPYSGEKQEVMFVVPSWAWHEHCNASSTERAVLFSIQDTPVMVALHKYREEAYVENDGHQTVTGVFGRRDEYG